MGFQIIEVETNKLYKIAGDIDTTNNEEFEQQFKLMLPDATDQMHCYCTDIEYVRIHGMRPPWYI